MKLTALVNGFMCVMWCGEAVLFFLAGKTFEVNVSLSFVLIFLTTYIVLSAKENTEPKEREAGADARGRA
jgi:hypothetical protein